MAKWTLNQPLIYESYDVTMILVPYAEHGEREFIFLQKGHNA